MADHALWGYPQVSRDQPGRSGISGRLGGTHLREGVWRRRVGLHLVVCRSEEDSVGEGPSSFGGPKSLEK
jgi:hypothetical protein